MENKYNNNPCSVYNEWRPLLEKQWEWDTFRSEICHVLKKRGDKAFIDDVRTFDVIGIYLSDKRYAYVFYVLAMIDYLSDVNHIKRDPAYDGLRDLRLPELLVPRDIVIKAQVMNDDNIIDNAISDCYNDECGRYFMKYNIMDKEIRNVV